MKYAAGLDLGQQKDFSALVIAERRQAGFLVRHIQRFPLQTSYVAVVEQVRQLLSAVSAVELAIDATGVGAAVIDMVRAMGMPCAWVPILIHGGDRVTYDDGGYYHVPKRDLVAVLQLLLQNRRLQILDRLPEAALLVRELQNFHVTVNPLTAHDSYAAWREGQHDDLVLAAALGLWVAEQLPNHQPTAGVWGT